MCGISGFIDPVLSATDADRLLHNMLKSIAHRGPDDSSIYNDGDVWLGHNRLSIIDLSSEANQPMHYDDLVIIFNGEIYNYIEIKQQLLREGMQFTTSSDTEVILASYRKWGTDCVKQFVGMWSFVIWDKRKKIFFASRDRFGIKPFYYIYNGSRFYFGSEYKPLKLSPLFSNELNLDQVSRGLQMGWVCYNDETYFEKIKALPAAHNLIIENGKITIERYWDIETGKYLNISEEEKKEKFLALFKDSVNLHLRSDVTVGSCLSGGLDSSAIAGMVQHLHPGIKYKSFSIYYEGKGDVDERPFIREVLNKYPAIEPYYYSPTDVEVGESFHHALYHADVPCTGSSFMSQYFLMKLIGSQKIKVVLDGQGSDEYLGGYMHTFYRVIADQLRNFKLSKALQTTTAISKQTGASFMPHIAKSLLSVTMHEQQLYALEYKKYYPFLSNQSATPAPFQLPDVNGNRTDNFLYQLMFSTSLPSLLHYEDRNSMAFSIESRVPFLDHRLVEFAFSLPVKDKVNGIVTKDILRQSLNGILPEAVKNRKDKKGFVTPGESKWLRGPLSHLLDFKSSDLPFLNADKVSHVLTEYKKGSNKMVALTWRLAVLNYWMKNFTS
ncbi:MAG: asparagine synthase (glutamine-hydrolyzing), partial [Bacteroidota bacterium]